MQRENYLIIKYKNLNYIDSFVNNLFKYFVYLSYIVKQTYKDLIEFLKQLLEN